MNSIDWSQLLLHKEERKSVQQFYWKTILTVRSTVYFYNAENLVLKCCHPDNEVMEKAVRSWGLQWIEPHYTASSAVVYVGRLISYWMALPEGNAFYFYSILTWLRNAFFPIYITIIWAYSWKQLWQFISTISTGHAQIPWVDECC